MNTAAIELQPRKVGVLLGLGIFLMPYIFAWFLLRKGHTQLARVVGFVWLGFMVLALAISPPAPAPAPQPVAPAPTPAIANSPTPAPAPAVSAPGTRMAALMESNTYVDAAKELPVNDALPALLITNNQTTVWDEKQWLANSSMAASAILKEVSKKYPNTYSRVDLEFTMPTVDKYGNASQQRGMVLTFDMADVRQVNWDNTTGWMILNLSKPGFGALGRSAYIAYCAEEKNARWADAFCASAANYLSEQSE